MKKYIILSIAAFLLMTTQTSCLHHGLDSLENSSSKDLTGVQYSYRFKYNDTIKKGTPNEDIQLDRVCEVVFNQKVESINIDGLKGYSTTISHDINCVKKAGPSGSVTKEMLYDRFKKFVAAEGLSRVWLSVTISDAATLEPLNGAPRLGAPGDFTKEQKYRVIAADGSTADYIIRTVKGF